jgi:hypothetical protein
MEAGIGAATFRSCSSRSFVLSLLAKGDRPGVLRWSISLEARRSALSLEHSCTATARFTA